MPEKEARRVPGTPNAAQADMAKAPRRILVADDDPDMLDTVAEAIAADGSEVVRAASGGELIQRLAEEGPFDLIVTDISMPWMSGIQVTQTARTAGLNTPV